MSNQELSVALRLYLESRGLDAGMNRTGRNWSDVTGRMGRDADRLGRLIGNIQSKIAQLGLGVGAFQNQRISARLDQDLNRIGQTAGASAKQVKGMRDELFALSRQTGNPVDGLKGSLGVLIASNLSWKSAIEANRAVNPAARVSGADPSILANALTVGASAFKIDLSQAGKAVEMLDQMVVAGEAGKAELEDLATIFGTAGNAAARANLQFKDTLAMIEVLAQTTPIAQLPVMVESTLRLFNNKAYADRASEASGVPFYDRSGAKRNPADVLVELAGKVQKAPNDQAREALLDKLLKGADLTTITGLGALFKDGELGRMHDIARQLESASGAVARKLPGAMENAVAQGERLRTIMRQAGDQFAMPVNKAVADSIEFSLRSKGQGGLGMSNSEMLVAGAGTFAVAGLLASIARNLPGKLLGGVGRAFGDTASTAIGVAQGKALEHAAGVTPVFVTNWQSGGAGGMSVGDVAGGAAAAAVAVKALKSFRLTSLGGFGLAGVAATNPMALLGPGAAFMGGHLAGSYAYSKMDTTDFADNLGGAIATVLARLGSDEAQAALDRRLTPRDMIGKLRIEIAQDGRARVAQLESSNNLDLQVGSGPLRALAN